MLNDIVAIAFLTSVVLFIIGFHLSVTYFDDNRNPIPLPPPSLPSPLFDYILKKGSPQIQYKIYKNSKKYGIIIKFHRGSGIDQLDIVSTWYKEKNTVDISRTYEFAEYTPEYFIKNFKKFTVKTEIRFRSDTNIVLSTNTLKRIISKIQILNLKFLCFTQLELDEEILEHFLLPSITDFYIHRCLIVDNFNIPLNAFQLLTSANKIEVPWQRNVTSMDSLMEIQRSTKFLKCSITRIAETLDAEATQKFINKFMVQGGGYLSLTFSHFT